MITLNGTIFVNPKTNKENLDYYLRDSKSKVTTIDADWINDFWDKAKRFPVKKLKIYGEVFYISIL